MFVLNIFLNITNVIFDERERERERNIYPRRYTIFEAIFMIIFTLFIKDLLQIHNSEHQDIEDMKMKSWRENI